MKPSMTYEGYSARIEFDPEDRIFVGHIAGINDVIGFHADNVSDLEAAFREAVDDYRETCGRIGKQPEKAFSGNLGLRIDPDLHAEIALAAELEGESLNAWAEEVFREAASGAKRTPKKRIVKARKQPKKAHPQLRKTRAA